MHNPRLIPFAWRPCFRTPFSINFLPLRAHARDGHQQMTVSSGRNTMFSGPGFAHLPPGAKRHPNRVPGQVPKMTPETCPKNVPKEMLFEGVPKYKEIPRLPEKTFLHTSRFGTCFKGRGAVNFTTVTRFREPERPQPVRHRTQKTLLCERILDNGGALAGTRKGVLKRTKMYTKKNMWIWTSKSDVLSWDPRQDHLWNVLGARWSPNGGLAARPWPKGRGNLTTVLRFP